MSKDASVIRIKPYFYIHVLDNNSNVTRIEIGPSTFTRQEHEKVVFGPEEMTKIPPRHYVVISNPIVRNPEPVFDEHGNPKLKFGDEEIRFDSTFTEPFPLFPGEVITGKVSPLPYINANNAIRLKAIRDCVDESKTKRVAGEEWIIQGPKTYYPQVEVKVAQNLVATIIKENEAIRLKAVRATTDVNGTQRKAGEEWLIRQSGAYLPGVNEEIVLIGGRSIVKAIVLTERKALHLKALKSNTDVYKKNRRAGEEWLVTLKDSSTHIPDVCEEVVGEVKITTLSNRQYCVILNPVGQDGRNKLGEKELCVGEVSFFLRPGERLEHGIQNIHVLGEEEALLLRARQEFKDSSSKTGSRKPGERWMLNGPTDYFPPVEVEIIEKRRRIPLDENEGIYVRDMKSGKVRSVCGRSYMLESYEELWDKPLPAAVEDALARGSQDRKSTDVSSVKRDKSRLVTYRAPHNSAVQVYDFKQKKARLVFGPGLVSLGPDEQFTLLSLSGSTPKKQGVIQSICLLLGPDFMTDVVIVETCDHARLALQLAYNWQFNISRDASDTEKEKIFSVPDFVGDACKAIASRVRGSVASATFDHFHRNSAEIIRTAVFGKDAEGNIRPVLNFPSNLLTVTGIDIQSVEPVDERTRDSLQKSVQLAIEITTNSQEAEARRESEKLGQSAKGQLEIQRITNEINNEAERKNLLALQAQSANVEATGQAIAEAQARADAAEIEAQAAVKQSELKAEAKLIESRAALEQETARNNAEVSHLKALNTLEVDKAREMSGIETKKFSQIVNSLGADTIQSMAQAGPELQAKLLSGLGLKSFMITDGNSPVNLFNTANGLVSSGLPQ